MTRPLPVFGAGAALALLLGGAMVGGLLTGHWWLVLLAGWALVSGTLLVQLDTWRRVRSLRAYVRDQVRAIAPTRSFEGGQATTAPAASPVTASPEDVVGAVRLLQAQYVGRLDRMQTALDETLVALKNRDDGPPQTG